MRNALYHRVVSLAIGHIVIKVDFGMLSQAFISLRDSRFTRVIGKRLSFWNQFSIAIKLLTVHLGFQGCVLSSRIPRGQANVPGR